MGDRRVVRSGRVCRSENRPLNPNQQTDPGSSNPDHTDPKPYPEIPMQPETGGNTAATKLDFALAYRDSP